MLSQDALGVIHLLGPDVQSTSVSRHCPDMVDLTFPPCLVLLIKLVVLKGVMSSDGGHFMQIDALPLSFIHDSLSYLMKWDPSACVHLAFILFVACRQYVPQRSFKATVATGCRGDINNAAVDHIHDVKYFAPLSFINTFHSLDSARFER